MPPEVARRIQAADYFYEFRKDSLGRPRMGIYDRDYYQGDELRPFRPWDRRTMVTMLIVVNAVVFVANYLFTNRSGGLMFGLALKPSDLAQPWQWYHLVTYGFAHDPRNIFHILFNMLTLYFLGQSVENKYGKWEFLRFYLLAIVLGGLVWSAMRLGAESGPLLGASGGATAVAMLFVFSFPQSTLYLYGALPVKAWILGIIIVVSNMLGSADYVAYDVHLVGAAFAAVYFFGHWNLGALGGGLGKLTERIQQKRRGLKIHRPEREELSSSPSKDELESDRILDKIHREGKDSLTSRERAFMERYSREMREKRKH
ncbi:MAG: rhomboid family intramembrane serine protease [Planctomycetales bacterium]|nr:rhomboid family intramembrane serine protease [Planctomycetales bacterium]